MPSRAQAARQSSFITPGRVAFTLIVLLLIAVFGVSMFKSSKPAEETSSAAPRTSAPSRPGAPRTVTRTYTLLSDEIRGTEVPGVNGETFKLADYRGKVLVLNMWATWCGPCRQEMPELVDFNREYRGRGVEFVGMATEANDPDIEKVRKFLRDFKVTYKNVYDDGAVAVALNNAVQARPVIPQTYVIARDGRIFKHLSGYSAERTPATLRQAIEDALNEK